jgi:hypothetical protein
VTNSLSNFPKISVLQDSTMVNGQLLTHAKMPMSAMRGPRGRDGADATTSESIVYESTSPALMSMSIETVEL